MLKEIFLGFTVLLLIGGILLGIFVWQTAKDIPSREELADIESHTASEVYSTDSVLLGRYFTENRTTVTYSEISRNVFNALIATEDARFFQHTGVDFRSLARVLVKTILMGDRSAGGGSTLSQQLVKNLYKRPGSGMVKLVQHKIKESFTASRLEEIYNKEELLVLYLNTVPFGEDVYGIETAALRFFNKPPAELSVTEAAVLVGMLKANTTYNPRLNPENATHRRNVVIRQMEKYGYLNDDLADSLVFAPLELDYVRLSEKLGTAPYFREKIRPMLEEILQKTKKSNGEPYSLYTDGLRITVPIHSRLQYYAEQAIDTHLVDLQQKFDEAWRSGKPWDNQKSILQNAVNQSERYLKLTNENLSNSQIQARLHEAHEMTIYTSQGAVDTFMSTLDSIKHYLMLLQSGLLAMDPKTGEIKAWVGGRDYSFFQYDHVTASRQVGSTFKPIVYTAALNKGIKPCDYFSNEREIYEDYDFWSPGNANNFYEGYYSLKGALTNSVNTISAKVIMETGINSVIDLAHDMGIKSELPQVPSLALGTAEIPLLEMVNAYSTIASGGYAVEPVYMLKVETSSGETIWEYQVEEPEEVLSADVTALVTNFMQSVVDSGTANSLRILYGLDGDIAGKTGTTQSHADGWFIGFTPDLVMGVWTGADLPAIHFPTITYGQGAKMSLPTWAITMKAALNDSTFAEWNESQFPQLSAEQFDAVNCPLYKEKISLLERIFGVRGKDRRKDIDTTESEKLPFKERFKRFFKRKD